MSHLQLRCARVHPQLLEYSGSWVPACQFSGLIARCAEGARPRSTPRTAVQPRAVQPCQRLPVLGVVARQFSGLVARSPRQPGCQFHHAGCLQH